MYLRCVRADSANCPSCHVVESRAMELWCKEMNQPLQVLKPSKLFEMTDGVSVETSLVWMSVSGKPEWSVYERIGFRDVPLLWQISLPGISTPFINHHRKSDLVDNYRPGLPHGLLQCKKIVIQLLADAKTICNFTFFISKCQILSLVHSWPNEFIWKLH